MAHLGSRAQLLLVGGVVVAFTIVGVALVLNALVLTDSLETSEPPRGIDHAGEYEAVVADGVDGLLRAEERTPYGSWSGARDNATAGVEYVDSLALNRTLQRQGAYASTDVSSIRQGVTLEQNNSSRAFTNKDHENTTWTLATTSGIRNFQMQVDADDLTAANDMAARNNPLPGFTLNVTDSDGDTWQAHVTATQSKSEVRLVVNPPNDAPYIACKSSEANATIDWTDASIESKPCDFTFPSGLDDSEYTLRFERGNEAAGTYHLVVSNQIPGDDVETLNFEVPGDGNPYYHQAVYSLVLDIEYDGPAVEYDSDPRVAPGEPLETGP